MGENFIGGNSKVLSNAEVLNYIQKAKSGDREAKDIIARHNFGLIVSIVAKKLNEFPQYRYVQDELLEYGMYGLTKAIETYNLQKSTTFSVYAYICIENEIMMYLRKEKRKINDFRFDEYFSDERETKIEKERIQTMEVDMDDDYIQKETLNAIKEVISTFSERDQKIIYLFFGFSGREYSQQEIARQVNISQSFVSRVIRKSIQKIKERLESEGHYIKQEQKEEASFEKRKSYDLALELHR